MNDTSIKSYDYNLPKEQIAETPLPQRHNSKLLHLNLKNDTTKESKMSNMGISNIYCARSPVDAIKTLEKNVSISNNVIVSGSFELVGPIREYLLNSQGKI